MTTIPNLIAFLNENNSTNDKVTKLKSFIGHEDEELIKKTLQMTFDKVKWTFGVSQKSIDKAEALQSNASSKPTSFDSALAELERLHTREFTGNAAIQLLADIFDSVIEEDKAIVILILQRDLKINMGRTQINKVFKNLIVKPPYMRCGLFTDKTASKITMNKEQQALLQLKADGSYIAITVSNGIVTFQSRSGETKTFPELERQFSDFTDGVYVGELLVSKKSIPHNDADFWDTNLNDIVLERALGNGELNRLPEDLANDRIFVQLWDKISIEEYSDAKHSNKDIKREIYVDRFESLNSSFKSVNESNQTPNIHIIQTHEVSSKNEALKITSDWMCQGLEGGIIKCKSGLFKDHTSPKQLKLKVVVDADVRITGFVEGKKGTKRANTFGAMTFETDDGLIKGSVSGFNDKQLEEINQNRDFYIGTIATVEFNALTKGRNNDYYAFSHPRIIELNRTDKQDTDTLERCLEMEAMAKGLS